MEKYQDILKAQTQKLRKALKHLEYSYRKIQNLPEDTEKLDEETLETWESFTARFSRVADIFLTRYLRTIILMNDPAFAGSLRDFINQAEKLQLIDNADAWMSIRELRNIAAHEYSEHDLTMFFKRLKTECPRLLNVTKLVENNEIK